MAGKSSTKWRFIARIIYGGFSSHVGLPEGALALASGSFIARPPSGPAPSVRAAGAVRSRRFVPVEEFSPFLQKAMGK